MPTQCAGPWKHKVNKEIRFLPLWGLLMGDSFLVIFWGLELMPACHMLAPGGCLLSMRTAPWLLPWTKVLASKLGSRSWQAWGKGIFRARSWHGGACGWWKVGTVLPNGHRRDSTRWWTLAFARCSAWTYTDRVGEPSWTLGAEQILGEELGLLVKPVLGFCKGTQIRKTALWELSAPLSHAVLWLCSDFPLTVLGRGRGVGGGKRSAWWPGKIPF